MTKFIEHRSARRKPSKKIVVLYHANCTDGFTAAWAAFKVLGKKAEYVPLQHQLPPPEGLRGKTVYLLDFSFSPDVMGRVVADAERVIALDHHVTAKTSTELATEHRYALDKSGARLAWEYFHPDEPVPYLVQIVEDMDLLRLALPDTVAIFEWLNLFPADFRVFNKVARKLESESGRRRAVREGELLKQYAKNRVEELLTNNAIEVEFDGHRVLAVNTESFHSELATRLAQGRPFGVVWRVQPRGVYVSLRSAEDGVDVGALAAKYGGGGHAHASGFVAPTVQDLPFNPIKA